MIKRLLIVFCCTFSATIISAQVRNKPFAIYSTIGLKTGFGLTSIENSNLNKDNGVVYNSNAIYSVGFKTNINYLAKRPINTILGVCIDYFFDQYGMELTKIESPLGDYYKKVTFKNRSLSIVGWYTNVPHRFILETGVQLNKFGKIDVENKGIHPDYVNYVSGYNYRGNYKNYASMVFGAGFYVYNFVVSLRQTVNITSITNEYANPVKDGFYNNSELNSKYEVNYKNQVPTTIYTAQITVEYYLPFIKYKRYWRGKKEVSIFQKVDPIYYWGKSLE